MTTSNSELTSDGTPLQRKRWSKLRITLALGFAALVALLALVFVIPSKSAFAPLPDPNGYHVLVQAAAKVEASNTETDTNEVEALVLFNRPALNEVRRALELPCAVPVQMNQRWMRRHTAEVSSFRRVANACDMEAALLRQQGATTEALQRCLDLTRFSHAISRNGLLVTVLMAMACENIALKRMSNLLSSLNAADCKRAAAVLYEQDRQRESLDQIALRDAEWARETYGFTVQLSMIARGGLRPDKAVMARAEKRFQMQSREARLVMLKLAARAFELEHGRKPQGTSELVPAFIPAVPVDPVSLAPVPAP